MRRTVGAFRWRLGLERLLPTVLWSTCLGVLLWVVTSALWGMGRLADPAMPQLIALLMPAVGLLIGLASWPSLQGAAREADVRLGIAERLGTALDLTMPWRREPAVQRVPSHLVQAQVQDALTQARAARQRWPSPLLTALDHVVATTGLSFLAVGALLVFSAGGSLPAAPSTLAGPPPDRLAALAPPAESAIPEPPPLASLEQPMALQSAPPPAAPQSQAAPQAGSQRAALDRLSRALGEVSATQPSAESLAEGNYDQAASQLSQLADEVDQLSDAAKQELARALRDAASATAGTDRQLAQSERQAAEALAGRDYDRQRRALQDLAEQMQQSAAGLTPGQPLAGTGQPQAAAGAAGAEGEMDRLSDQTGSGAGDGEGTGGEGGEGGLAGDQPPPANPNGAATNGQAAPKPPAGQGQRLDAAGEKVEVPAQVSGAPAIRPATPDELSKEQQDGLQGGDAREALRPQEMGSVAPERNALPNDYRRDLVREYFR